jgi:isopentenyl phosphate kinase
MRTLYLLYLDRHHLGDDLFLKSLAQHFAEGPSGEPLCLLVHGSGEKVERTLEAQGVFPERTEGVLNVDGEEQRRLVERAVREVNQEIVAALTDEVVSTVGIQGVDRNLLGRDAEGRLQALNAGWVATLLKQRVVPVVSALVEDEQVEEVWAADVLVALAEALSASFDPVACVLTRTDRAGLSGPEGVRASAPLAAVSDDDVPEPAAVRRMAEAGLPVLVTTLQGLCREEGPEGTRIEASAPSGPADAPRS